MVTPKKKRLAGTAAVIALWMGTVIFAFTGLVPALQEMSRLQEELNALTLSLQEKLQKPETPSRGAIETARQRQRTLEEQLEEINTFYLHIQNNVLEERILESDTGDPYHIAARFRELRRDLEEKAGTTGFLDLGRVTDWARRDDGRPTPDKFRRLEKKSSLANNLVRLLTNRPDEAAPHIMALSLGEASRGPGQPDVPPTQRHRGVRFDIIPVEMTVRVPFSETERLLNDLLSVTHNDPKPLLILRSVDIKPFSGEEGGTGGLIQLKADMDVLDFYRPQPETDNEETAGD